MVAIRGARSLGVLCTAVVLTLLIVLAVDEGSAQSLPAAVEDVAHRSDLIVLGRVTDTAPEGIALGTSWKMLYTHHTFEVEAYYKGSGPKTIPLFTPGGFETRLVDGELKRYMSQVSGAVGVRDGEEILAFLRAAHGGYVFIEWRGAKYPVKTDPDTSERFVDLRLRKKKNMRGTALESFQRVLASQEGADPEAELEKRLMRKGGLRERIAVEDLQERISMILRKEITASEKGPEVTARGGAE